MIGCSKSDPRIHAWDLLTAIEANQSCANNPDILLRINNVVNILPGLRGSLKALFEIQRASIQTYTTRKTLCRRQSFQSWRKLIEHALLWSMSHRRNYIPSLMGFRVIVACLVPLSRSDSLCLYFYCLRISCSIEMISIQTIPNSPGVFWPVLANVSVWICI